MFNPARLTLARRRRRLSKKALAEALGFDQKTIIRYEAEGFQPSEESLAALARFLDFPERFFFGEDTDEMPVQAASFRSLKSMSARDRDAALAAGSIAFLFDDWVDARFELPMVNLPDLKEDIDPESAAASLRQAWGLGTRHVSNIVHLLESKGVRVFSLAENTKTVDAFSLWRRGKPYVFLNTFKTSERSRFDAAHELGHLVLHKHGGPHDPSRIESGDEELFETGPDAERQANAFASAFLMPRSDVLAKIPRVNTLNQLVQAKKHWGVSVSALNYRLHKLGVVSDWQYRQFNIQITQNFGRAEPNELKRETSALWEKVLTSLRQDKITKHTIAEALALPVAELESLVFGLAKMQSIEGSATTTRVRSRAYLRIVDGDG